MKYDNDNFRKLEALSHSDDPTIREKAGNWLIGIGLHDVDGLRVSPCLIELALRNVKGELSSDDVTRLLNEYHANQKQRPHNVNSGGSLDGEYEIIPPDDPRSKEIEEANRRLRPEFYARLDAERAKRDEK